MGHVLRLPALVGQRAGCGAQREHVQPRQDEVNAFADSDLRFTCWQAQGKHVNMHIAPQQ